MLAGWSIKGIIDLIFVYNPRYGGTHRLRFDSKGQGLGVAGRRDIRKINVVLLIFKLLDQEPAEKCF